jgi:hypothetical protein
MAGDADSAVVLESVNGPEAVLQDLNVFAQVQAEVDAGVPFMGYVDVMVAEGNGNDTIDSDTSPLSGMSDDFHASPLRRPVVDAQMAGVAMPMTPGLPPLTPDLIPVAPPSDFFKLIVSLTLDGFILGCFLCPCVCIQRYSLNCASQNISYRLCSMCP